MPKRDDSVEIENLPSLQASKTDDLVDVDETQQVQSLDHESDKSSSDPEVVDEHSVMISSQSDNDIPLDESDSANEGFDGDSTAVLDPVEASAADLSHQISSVSTTPKLLYVCVVVLFIAIIGLIYALLQQSESLESAQNRIADLENRLSTTDESVNQSSVALQVKVKELKDKTDDLWKQMDKLWASAWRRNQTEIASHTKSIEKHQSSISEAAILLEALEKQNKALLNDVSNLKQKSSDVTSIQKSLQKQELELSKLQQTFKSMQQSQLSNKALAEENAEWIQSINVFRKQTNQAISRLDKQINQSTGK